MSLPRFIIALAFIVSLLMLGYSLLPKSGSAQSPFDDNPTATTATPYLTEDESSVSGASETPALPTGLTSKPGDRKALLDWDDADRATSYEVQQWYGYSPNPRWRVLPFKEIESSSDFKVNITGSSAIVTGLTNGVCYSHRIRSVNSEGMSNWTSKVDTCPEVQEGKDPGIPKGLTATTTNITRYGTVIILRWEIADNSNTYDVQQRDGSTWRTLPFGSFNVVVAGPAAGIWGIEQGSTYEYRVRGVNRDLTSDWSSKVTITVPKPSVSISASRRSIEEGRSIQFTVSSDPAPNSELTVKVAVTQEGDYIKGYPPTSVGISSSTPSTNFTVDTNNDNKDERNGSITASISTSTGQPYKLGIPSSVTVTVTDNDLPTTDPVATSTVSFGSSSYSVTEGASTTVYVDLSSIANTGLSIPIEFTPPTGDYSVSNLNNGTLSLTISAGSRSVPFAITATQDRDCSDETVSLGFGTLPSGISPGSISSASVTIDDDDRCDTPTPPGKPQNLRYTPANVAGSVVLKWNPVSNATGYEVRQCITVSGSCSYSSVKTLVGRDTSTTTVTGLDADQTHKFRIRAVKGAYHTDSDVITVNLKPVPQDLVAKYTDGVYSQVKLTWNAVSNPDATYVVNRAALGHTDRVWLTITPTIRQGRGTLLAVVENLELGETYHFRVKARSAQGDSNWSAEASAYVKDERPPQPDNLAGEYLIGYRGLKLSWDVDSSGETISYEVETDPTDSFIKISPVTTALGRKYVSITGLDLIEYEFKVYGKNYAVRSKDQGTIYAFGSQPSYLWGHQADHTVKYDRSGVKNTIIRWGVYDAARDWNTVLKHLDYGLKVCDDDLIPCRGRNSDGGVVTVKTVETSKDNTWVGCGIYFACVGNEKLGGRSLLDLDMIYKDPIFQCPRDAQSCDAPKRYI